MTFEWNGQIQSDTASHLVLTPPTFVLEVAFQSSFGSAKVVSTSSGSLATAGGRPFGNQGDSSVRFFRLAIRPSSPRD
jgi:hypothetical protein